MALTSNCLPNITEAFIRWKGFIKPHAHAQVYLKTGYFLEGTGSRHLRKFTGTLHYRENVGTVQKCGDKRRPQLVLSTAFMFVAYYSRSLIGDYSNNSTIGRIPLTVRSKAWVCGRSLAGIAGSNPAGGMYV